ncbi:MAG: F0F1 ATP synthase subunit A [Planctomycetota bacterium]
MMGFLPIASGDDPLSHVKDWVVAGPVTVHTIYATISALLCITILPWVAQRIVQHGTGGRVAGLFEVILLFLRDEVARPFLGKEGDKYLPVLWSFFFFILFCNLLGLIPLPIAYTATSNLNVTIGLAVCSFCFYHAIGIKENGLVHYLKANLLVGPPFLWPLMILVEALGHILKPAALAIRLFANMVAGHTVLAVLIGFAAAGVKLFADGGIGVVLGGGVTLASVAGSVAIYCLEIFIGFLQAFIFTFLTTVFLSMAVHPDH